MDLKNPRPFVYASGRYGNEFNKTSVVIPIGAGRNGNVLIYDLRQNFQEVLEKEDDPEKELRQKFYPTIKELCLNKCPAVAPINVLEGGNGWEKIGLSKEKVNENLKILKENMNLVREIAQDFQKAPEFPEAEEPEGALYDGFLNDQDKIKVEAVRNAEPEKLADFHPEFDDERLPELLLHYKGRNFPETLAEDEYEKWEEYRRSRLERQMPKFMEDLANVQDDFIRDELMLSLESLA